MLPVSTALRTTLGNASLPAPASLAPNMHACEKICKDSSLRPHVLNESPENWCITNKIFERNYSWVECEQLVTNLVLPTITGRLFAPPKIFWRFFSPFPGYEHAAQLRL
jgi:hypothetical protein